MNLIPLRLFFSRKQLNDVHIHVVKENCGEISWNFIYQNYLRENKDARYIYAKVKLDLIKENPSGFNVVEGLFSEYTIKNGEIIRKFAKETEFNDYRFVSIDNYNEFDSYKKLMNLNKIDLNRENIFHLYLLYKWVEIVAAACVEFNIQGSIAIKSTNSEGYIRRKN